MRTLTSVGLLGMLWLAVAAIFPGYGHAEQLPCPVEIIHHQYSGLPNDPTWSVTSLEDKVKLMNLLIPLKRVKADEGPSQFGLGSYSIRDTEGCIVQPAPQSIAVDGPMVKITRQTGEPEYYLDERRRVEAWIEKTRPAKN